MKYYKVIFNISDLSDQILKDTTLLQTAKDVLCAISAEAGFESFEECENGINGYVQQQTFNEDILVCLLSDFPVENVKISYHKVTAEDKDWNQAWEKDGFEPILIKDKCIIHDAIHPVPKCKTDMIDITIDAKQAFGTGTHETTKMIVKQLLSMDIHGMNVLDCGCGTGILSIVAAKKNAKNVICYDIDEWSVKNTKHNCSINEVKNISIFEGNANIIKSLNQKFNVILANINRNILLADMPEFSNALDSNGLLILSGFYTEDAPILINKAQRLGLKHIKSVESNNWCMLVLTTTKK